MIEAVRDIHISGLIKFESERVAQDRASGGTEVAIETANDRAGRS